MGNMPNTTNWKSRSGKNEVDNKYTIKDFLRKVKILRSINNIFKKNDYNNFSSLQTKERFIEKFLRKINKKNNLIIVDVAGLILKNIN